MKRLWFPAALLLLMFAAALGNALALERFTGSLAQTLLQAEERVGREDWDGAEALIRQAREDWHRRDGWLHVTLRHADTDEIQIGFDETLRLLLCREMGGYAAASAQLGEHLQLVAGAEQLTLENLF